MPKREQKYSQLELFYNILFDETLFPGLLDNCTKNPRIQRERMEKVKYHLLFHMLLK